MTETFKHTVNISVHDYVQRLFLYIKVILERSVWLCLLKFYVDDNRLQDVVMYTALHRGNKHGQEQGEIDWKETGG